MEFLGKMDQVLNNIVDVFLTALINILSFMLSILNNIRDAFMALIVLVFIAFLNPIFAVFLLGNRMVWIFILIFLIVPFAGKRIVEFLKYLRYMLTEYLSDKSRYRLENKPMRYSSIGSYGEEYYRKKEEKRQREYQEYARAQQEYWERLFRDFYNQQQGSYNHNRTGGSNRSTFYNPTEDFVKEYEESCRILGIEPTTDKAEIQRAYRAMAKKYHPDINRDPDATEKFQKINEANAFLGEENINRYRQIKNS